MELNEIKAKFDQEIQTFVDRIRINHIVCEPPIDPDGTIWTEGKCEKFLKANPNNKLIVRNAFVTNNHENICIALPADEMRALNEVLKKCTDFIRENIIEFCKHGQNQYELNELIRNTIMLIDFHVTNMNYKTWLSVTVKNFEDENFLIRYDKKKVYKNKVFINDELCKSSIHSEFEYRRLLLYQLKISLVDIYSEYLLLPTIGVNPKLKYSCSKPDICELILAIENSTEITDSQKLKAILIDIFEITDYNKVAHEIISRTLGKAPFLNKMAIDLNKRPAPKKRNKASK